MTMKVHLSYYQYLRNFESFLGGLDTTNPEELKITTHEKWVNIHPAILTMIAALGQTMDPQRITIDDITAASGHYLARMGLFKALGKKSPYSIEEHESAGKFIPLTQICAQEEQSKFITDMIPLLHLDPNHADAIKYVVGELVRNVLEHAGAENGAFVAAQYYPQAKVVRLGISDTGVGIWKTIHQSWPAKNDIEAIKLALTPGITGTTRHEGGTEANAGAGLFFIKSMAVVARDYFVLYSGSGAYKLTKRDKRTKGLPRLKGNPSDDKHTETNDAPNFPGTVVALDISLDETSEFPALLAAISSAYTKAIKERKKQRYKQPRFE